MGWQDMLKKGSAVAKVFLPGGAGVIIDIVNESIDDTDDPNNEAALRALAETQAEIIKRIQQLEKDR